MRSSGSPAWASSSGRPTGADAVRGRRPADPTGRGGRRRPSVEARADSSLTVHVALEARLFGRFRLLSIDAAVDAERWLEPVLPSFYSTVGLEDTGQRRADVEAVLRSAQRTLDPSEA